MFRILTTSLGALILAAPLVAAPVAAFAQDVPSYAQSADEAPGDQQLRGRITDFDGGYSLTVRDERGYIDNVELHPGTIINPTGLTLAPGMTVSILGYNQGDSFAANEIDTPYEYSSGVPYYAGHPWNYYDSGVSLAFFFGNLGWWHGNDFHGDYRYDRGARYYNDVRIRNVYNDHRGGGSFHGRAYVAPPEHGGYYRGSGRNDSNGRTQRNATVDRQNYARPQQPDHFAGPPIQHGYSRPQAVDNGRNQNQSEARPQYRNEARPQVQPQVRQRYNTEARPQVRNEARPQIRTEARPQIRSEAPPQNRTEARPQNHSEARPQAQGDNHDHGGGRPH